MSNKKGDTRNSEVDYEVYEIDEIDEIEIDEIEVYEFYEVCEIEIHTFKIHELIIISIIKLFFKLIIKLFIRSIIQRDPSKVLCYLQNEFETHQFDATLKGKDLTLEFQNDNECAFPDELHRLPSPPK